MYLTDPLYPRDYWHRTAKSEQPVHGVYYFDPKSSGLKLVAHDLTQPNGIIGTPDGKTLYVADIAAKKTYSYTINADGTLTDKKLFCDMGSDGMTIDDQGNIYLTGKGVTVFDKTGKQIAHVDIKEPWTANVCFGGKDKNVLFITASKAIYTLKMDVKGAGSQ
jgi:gluconolactonase